MTVVVVALVVVLVLGLAFAELVVRSGADYAIEPLLWHDRFTLRKELQMRRLARRGGVDVVAIGSSMVLFGIDAHLLQQRTGRTVFNASIYRGVPTVSELFLRDRVLKLLRPRLVVIGYSPAELNDQSPLASRLQEYRAASVFDRRLGRRIRAFLGVRSWLVLYLPLLVQPRKAAPVVKRGLRPASWRWRVPLEVPGVLGALGEGHDFAERTFKVMPRMQQLVIEQVGPGYFVNGGEQLGAYHRMVALIRERGAEPLFAAMPLPAELYDGVFEGGRERWKQLYDELAVLAEELGVPFVDVAAGLEDNRYFGDLVHLNGAGRQLFTERLAEALAPHLPVTGRG